MIVVSCLLSPVSTPALAAELSLQTKAVEVGVAQPFQVDLMLNPESESVNALEGRVAFSKDFFELKEIRDGNSLVNFWIERPRLGAVDAAEEVIFSGIVPGGYAGPSRLVFSLIFEARQVGEGQIEIKEARVLRNDGQGTPATLSLRPLSVKSTPTAQAALLEALADKIPPDDFLPLLGRDGALFGGQHFLAFAAQDKQSGIDHYEVKETRDPAPDAARRHGAGEEGWVRAESPYLLQDQNLKSYIQVKAVDKAGNERVVTLPPAAPPAPYLNYLIWAIIIIAAAASYLAWRLLWRKKASP